ncbi:hypothetical protein BX600DRAFT_436759 [Xylariales sp. PMI_506]|nr:hypothetical protein BX600DRAFT_436759 [Xylariales sp. PMI_506]
MWVLLSAFALTNSSGPERGYGSILYGSSRVIRKPAWNHARCYNNARTGVWNPLLPEQLDLLIFRTSQTVGIASHDVTEASARERARHGTRGPFSGAKPATHAIKPGPGLVSKNVDKCLPPTFVDVRSKWRIFERVYLTYAVFSSTHMYNPGLLTWRALLHGLIGVACVGFDFLFSNLSPAVKQSLQT